MVVVQNKKIYLCNMNEDLSLEEKVEKLDDKLSRLQNKFRKLTEDFNKLRHEQNTIEGQLEKAEKVVIVHETEEQRTE